MITVKLYSSSRCTSALDNRLCTFPSVCCPFSSPLQRNNCSHPSPILLFGCLFPSDRQKFFNLEINPLSIIHIINIFFTFVAYLLLYKILHVKKYRCPCFKTLFLTQCPLFLLHAFFPKKKKKSLL